MSFCVVVLDDGVEVVLHLFLLARVLAAFEVDFEPLGVFFEDLVVPCLVDVVVNLYDAFLLALNELLQVLQVLLTHVAVAVCLEGFQCLVLESGSDAVDFSAFRRIVWELFPEDLLVTFNSAIVGRQAFVLSDLLPGSLDVGYFV